MLDKRFKLVIFLLMTALLVGILGCQQAKKPQTPPQKSPEVAKYKQEPTISLYRANSKAKEDLKLERYLKGVVAAEIGDKFPMEALKAQAIVARTMTLALMEYENGARDKHGTDASDKHTEFQAYNQNQVTDKISQAVDATRGQVLTTNGKFVYALFHSVSRNKTASIEEGFPELKDKYPYIVPVDAQGLKYAPAKYKNWTVKVSRAEIKGIMGAKAGNLNDIKVSKRGPSGRALTISAGNASIRAVDLRRKVGFDKLYSTHISSITPQGNYIVFKGSGWGHGCGLEQWGAYTMAKDQKKSAQEIVTYYFPQARLTNLYK